MRILQVHNVYRQAGGEDVVVETEAKLLRSAGHDVVQYIAKNPDGKLGAVGALTLAPWNPVARSQISRIAREGFDVAHVHNTWFALTPSVISGLEHADVPVVMTAHNYRLACINALLTRDHKECVLCVGSSPSPGIRYKCYRDSRLASAVAAATISLNRSLGTWDRYVQAFVAPTPYAKEILVKGGISQHRVVVKPHMTPDPGPRRSPPSHSDRFLFVGRLSREKGIQMLLDAWQRVDKNPMQLTIVGDGPLREELLELRLKGVSFPGHLSSKEIRGLMHGSRALLFPSLWPESFGLVVAEAMSCGLPILATRDLPIAALFREDSGFVELEEQPRAWSEGLSELFDDELVDSLGSAARRTYVEEFSPSVGLPRLERILAHAMASRSQR